MNARISVQGSGKLAVMGSVHMFSDQYLDKEENNKVMVRRAVLCLVTSSYGTLLRCLGSFVAMADDRRDCAKRNRCGQPGNIRLQHSPPYWSSRGKVRLNCMYINIISPLRYVKSTRNWCKRISKRLTALLNSKCINRVALPEELSCRSGSVLKTYPRGT